MQINMATPTYPLLPDKFLPNALNNWVVPSAGFSATLNAFQPLQLDPSGALVTTSSGGGGSTTDRELVVSAYFVSTAFTGASAGDTVTATQVIDVSGAPTTISTIWRNQTTGVDFASAPAAANLTLVGSQALTNGQLRASAVAVTDTAAEASLASIATNTAVQFGGGVTTATTQRVTLATDGPGITNLSTIATNTTGVSTAANQTTGNGYLSTIATNTGALATSANQATAQASLTAIATNTNSAQRTQAIATVTGNGTVAAGAARVTFLFSSNFGGSILGAAFAGGSDSSLTIDSPRPEPARHPSRRRDR